jgi:hypothetical protein
MQQFRIFRALGMSFKAWFRNLIPFTLIAAVLYAPAVLWELRIDATGLEGEALFNAFFGPSMYLLIALSTLLAPMITYRVIQDLNGAKVSMMTSLQFGLRGVVPALMVTIVSQGLMQIPIAGAIIATIAGCIWFVATPAAVAERLGAIAALTRSSQLTAGRRWGIFGLALMVNIVGLVLLTVWLLPQMREAGGDTVGRVREAALTFMIVIGVFQMFYGIAQAVSYALLRQDKDGVSHEELAKIFD